MRGTFDRESAVVKCTFHLLDPQTGSADAHGRAVALLRQLVPGTLGADDAAPRRIVLFGTQIDEITGRPPRPGAR